MDEPARDPRGSLEWPGVPQPAPERLVLAATPRPHVRCSHTILHTSAHTQSHNITTSRPHTVNQTPCSGKGEGKTTQRGLRKGGRGSVYTAGQGGSAGASPGHPRPTPRAGMLTHAPSPLPHTFSCVSNTLQSRTHTLHKRGAHTGMSHHPTRGGEVRRRPTPRRVTRVAHRGPATHR